MDLIPTPLAREQFIEHESITGSLYDAVKSIMTGNLKLVKDFHDVRRSSR